MKIAGIRKTAIIDTAWIPSTSINSRQAAHQARTFGIFLHYGINTFNDTEWSDGATPVSTYNPSALDCAQWVSTAKSAGASYIIAIAKHHDGFTLWNSADTSYGVKTSGAGNSTDVIGALATACAAQGIKLALYYSLWDRHRNSDTANTSLDAAYVATMISHLTELFSNYGPICELWLDGGWEKDYVRWGLASLYTLFRTKQPLGVMMTNQTIVNWPQGQVAGDAIVYPPTDYRTQDSRYPRSGDKNNQLPDPDPKTFTAGGNTYYLPLETPITINSNANWMYHPSTSDTDFIVTSVLVDSYMRCASQGNNFVLNLCPNTVGVVSSAQITQLMTMSNWLGLSALCNLVDYAEGKIAVASSEYSASFVAGNALTGQVLGGPRWSGSGSDLTNPWFYVDMGSTKSVSRVALKEWYNGTFRPSTLLGTYSVQTSPDASTWTTQTTGTGATTGVNSDGDTYFQWAVTTFSPVSARYVRILFGTVTAAPTFNSFRIY